MARIIDSLREKYLLKDLLSYLKFPKSTYMYWKKRFDRKNKDESFENQIKKIRKDNPNYRYRRIHAMLRRIGLVINKKKVQRLIQKLKLQVTNFARKSRKYYSYKGTVGKVAPNRIKRRFNTSVVHQKITTDTSEFKYYETDKSGNMQVKKLYLNPFLDMFNGEIISYSITSSTNKKKKEKRVKNDKDVNKKNGLEDLRNGLIKTDLDSMISDITNNKVNTVGTTKVMVNKDMDIKTNTKIQWTISLELTNNIATRWELDTMQTSTKSN